MRSDQDQADIEACERALAELLTTMIDHDADEAATQRRRQLREAEPDAVVPLERMAFRSLVTDPVRMVLRDGVKRLGREIYRLGGNTGAMMASLDRVAEMDPRHAGRRGAILDSAWNGIGEGDDRWWS